MDEINLAGKQIVVGVDGSASAVEAARWAAEEAARLNVPMLLVHAITPPRYPSDEGVWATEIIPELAVEADEYLRDATAAAQDRAPGAKIEAKQVHEDPMSALVSMSDSARLVVLGSRGLGGFTGMLIGSIAVGVTAHAQSPVVVVRGTSTPDGPVVVGVDGSPLSERALAMAYEEASLRGAELIAVHAWSDIPAQSYTGMARTFEQWDAEQVKAEEVLAERLAGYREHYPDVVVTRVVSKDQPAAKLLEHVAGAQLAVVGSRGRGAFSGLLLGSVSQAMIYHAPCPVLVVRG